MTPVPTEGELDIEMQETGQLLPASDSSEQRRRVTKGKEKQFDSSDVLICCNL